VVKFTEDRRTKACTANYAVSRGAALTVTANAAPQRRIPAGEEKMLLWIVPGLFAAGQVGGAPAVVIRSGHDLLFLRLSQALTGRSEQCYLLNDCCQYHSQVIHGESLIRGLAL
jgi:hypothetical protein